MDGVSRKEWVVWVMTTISGGGGESRERREAGSESEATEGQPTQKPPALTHAGNTGGKRGGNGKRDMPRRSCWGQPPGTGGRKAREIPIPRTESCLTPGQIIGASKQDTGGAVG